MQNYIYRNCENAIKAATGQFELYCCRNCGFAFNGAYDSSLLSYDENYSVFIPSETFTDYYKEIAAFLYDKFQLENGLVIDIGCGKGTFLEVLCGMYGNVRGLGIDPTFEFNNRNASAHNLKFVKDVFRKEYITQKPSLIICRHAFDQIEHPLSFLKSVHSALTVYKEIPFFIEVADLEWIIENNAFWDFCYERCSYFTADSLQNTLYLAGYKTESIQKAFNDTYLWAFGTTTQDNPAFSADNSISDKLLSYSLSEKSLLSKTKSKLQKLKAEGNRLAVWGMATKGVVFCNLIDPEKKLLDYCIDINQKKFRCFVPHTGHQINTPEKLCEADSSKLVVVIMNPNYLDEIKEVCLNLNLTPNFINAAGNDLFGG